MKKTVFFFRLWIFFILTSLSLSLLGCASPKSGKDLPLVEEEAYIDLKRNFSLVVPTSWERVKLPVAHPAYRADTVTWQIPGNQNPTGTLRIRILPRQAKGPLQEKLALFLNGEKELLHSNALSFQHPAGPALRLNGLDQSGPLIYLVIGHPKQSFILAFNLSASEYERILPTIEKIILSFTII